MQTYIGVDPALGRDQSACAVFKLGEDGKPELIGAAIGEEKISEMMRFIESDDEPPPELDGDTEADEDDDDFEDEDEDE
jgi:hypothetical protein